MSDRQRVVARVVNGQPASDGAGVRLMRILGTQNLDHHDPFLLLDEFRNENPDDYITGFPAHPHRGFETVTYMLEGLMRHEDSVGNNGLLTPGSVQWMTAGQGIIHSEMPEQSNGLLWGYQLWVNLPASLKMAEPRYQDIPAEQIPETSDPGERVRIIAGAHAGVAGAAETLTGVTYLDVHLEAGASFAHDLADGHNSLAYVYEGALTGADTVGRSVEIGRGQLGILSPFGAVNLAAETGARFLFIAGAPINEPVERMGPFVMNTREELMQAAQEYRAGTFAA